MNGFVPIVLFLAQIMVGSEFAHTVQTGDSLTVIGARLGVDVHVLAEANGLKAAATLKPGQALKVDNRHIVPPWAEGVAIVINVPQRMLFFFEGGDVSCGCPIAAGKPDWKTPLGDFEIVEMEKNPTWDVPPSIQEEMRRAGKTVLTRVPPSPQNPLGQYWMRLSLPGVGIHGTNAPSSIYKLATHGCIRLHADDVKSVFAKADVGTRGRVIYEPLLMARTADAVFLEMHPDAYKKQPNPFEKVMDIATSAGFADMLDLALVKEVIRKRDGIARDVTLR